MNWLKYCMGSILLSLVSLPLLAQTGPLSPQHGGTIASAAGESPYVVEMVHENGTFTFYIYDENGQPQQPADLEAKGKAEFDFEDPVLAERTGTVSQQPGWMEITVEEEYPVQQCKLTLWLNGEQYKYNFSL